MKNKKLSSSFWAFSCAALMGISFFSSPARAVDSVYLGLGKTSCKEFSKIAAIETPEGKEKYKPFLIWVSGAGTGYENACRSIYNNQCSGKNLDLGRLMVGVRDQCNIHPTDLLGDAVTEAWRLIYFTQKSIEKQEAAKEQTKKNPYKKKYQHPKASKLPTSPKKNVKHPTTKKPIQKQGKPLKQTKSSPTTINKKAP
ncbi:hypothetical protein FAI41_04855 [Acetobacteraceae bacterium]|nr:hypothetical protein FAI41_04855 [Acetobacteraceae bacterium]